MKKYLSLIVFFFIVSSLFSQDLIYTVSGEIEGNKNSLDSIKVHNISNDTHILFDNLPILEYYQINLTQKAFWGTVGVFDIEEAPPFDVVENMPGSLTIVYLKNFPTDVKLAVYNINGQKVYASERKTLSPGNSIRVHLSAIGVFIVKIEAPFGTQTFKAIGADNVKDYNVEISDIAVANVVLKSANSDDDFSFISGDSIVISVFKEGYNSTPSSLKIDTSEFVNFILEAKTTGVVGSFTDSRDGRKYKTVTINGKEWMTENMAYLPSVSKVNTESTTEPIYYVYDYNDTIVSEAIATDSYKIYGVLYNHPAAKNACPEGWHLPTNDEWVKLARFVTDQNELTHTTGDFWDGVGKYLKASEGWVAGNGLDKYGFNGLPGGYRHMNGNFYGLGSSGFWWSATELSSTNAFSIYMQSSSDYFIQSHNDTNFGYCIHCIKD